jgi:hypothetical protein
LVVVDAVVCVRRAKVDKGGRANLLRMVPPVSCAQSTKRGQARFMAFGLPSSQEFLGCLKTNKVAGRLDCRCPDGGSAVSRRPRRGLSRFVGQVPVQGGAADPEELGNVRAVCPSALIRLAVAMCSGSATFLRRPNLVPLAWATYRLSAVRSLTSSRSYSASAPRTPIIIRPAAVLESMPSVVDTKVTPRSVSAFTVSRM